MKGLYEGGKGAKIKLSYDDVVFQIDIEFGEHFDRDIKRIIEMNIPLAYRAGFRKALSDLKKAGIKIESHEFTIRDLEAIKVLNENGFSLCKTLGEDAKKESKRIISEGYLRGASINEIADELRDKVGSMTRNRAEMIARTETIRAYNTAATNQYNRYGVKKWVWITAFDDRTCNICANLDGTVHEYGEPTPPAHPLCRCSVLPYVA